MKHFFNASEMKNEHESKILEDKDVKKQQKHYIFTILMMVYP